jgi:hypothetical protein
MKSFLKGCGVIAVMFGFFYAMALAAVAEETNNALAISANAVAMSKGMEAPRFSASCYTGNGSEMQMKKFIGVSPELTTLASSGKCYVVLHGEG